MTWHLCGQAKQGQTRREDLCPGAVVLRGFAVPDATAIFAALHGITTQAPFRHMVTPGGFRMLVAMTNCGASGWVTDRTGYRYDAVDPESGKPWPRMPGVFLKLAHDAAASAGFEGFQLDACLINRDEPGARLSLHQDKNENGQTVRVESKLKDLQAPTLIVWGMGDIFLDRRWSYWLADTIPGATRRVEFEGARMLFPEEHPEELSDELRAHWNNAL